MLRAFAAVEHKDDEDEDVDDFLKNKYDDEEEEEEEDTNGCFASLGNLEEEEEEEYEARGGEKESSFLQFLKTSGFGNVSPIAPPLDDKYNNYDTKTAHTTWSSESNDEFGFPISLAAPGAMTLEKVHERFFASVWRLRKDTQRRAGCHRKGAKCNGPNAIDFDATTATTATTNVSANRERWNIGATRCRRWKMSS